MACVENSSIPQSREMEEGCSDRWGDALGELGRGQTSKSFGSSLDFILKTMGRPGGNFSRGRASFCSRVKRMAHWVHTLLFFDLR